MDINRLTEKAQEALAAAQRRAVSNGQQQVDVEHLLAALLDQEPGLAASIFFFFFWRARASLSLSLSAASAPPLPPSCLWCGARLLTQGSSTLNTSLSKKKNSSCPPPGGGGGGGGRMVAI